MLEIRSPYQDMEDSDLFLRSSRLNDPFFDSMVLLRDQFHEKIKQRALAIERQQPDKGRPSYQELSVDPEYRKLADRAISTDMLCRRYAKAVNESAILEKSPEDQRRAGMEAVQAWLKKLQSWLKSGGRKTLGFDKTEADCCDDAIRNRNNLMSRDDHPLETHDDALTNQMGRRDFGRVFLGVSAALGGISAGTGAMAKVGFNHIPDLTTEGREVLEAAAAEKEAMLKDREAWNEKNKKATNEQWRKAMAKENRHIPPDRTADKAGYWFLSGVSGVAALGALASALEARRHYNRNKPEMTDITTELKTTVAVIADEIMPAIVEITPVLKQQSKSSAGR